MVTTPDKVAQEAEAAARQAAGASPGETTAAALAVVEHGAPQDPGPAHPAPTGTPPAEPQRPVPEPKSKFDSKRDEITARFRTDRLAEAEEAPDDISAFTRSGLPPELAPEPAAEPAEPAEPPAEGEPAAPEPPQLIKLKVHGKEIELPLDQVIAKAQIAVAADNVLDEAKTKLGEVNSLLAQTRDKVARGDQQSGQHQPQPQPTAQPAQPQPAPADLPNQEDPLDKLIESLQFGDTQEAKTLLRKTIAEAATSPEVIAQTVQQQMLNERIRDDGARAAKVLLDFKEKHKDLAEDPMAQAAMEATMLQMQTADLTALGLDPNRIRPDGLPSTPGDIARAHQFYRAQGMNVRSPQTMLEESRDKLLEWKGIKQQPTAEPTPKPPPRVEVSVDRTARRAAVPQQPSRTAAPRPDAQANPAPRDRSSIVEAEKARRAKLRGQNLGIAS
jgi:hypothetical protein